MTVYGRHSKHRIIVEFLAAMGSILLVRLFFLTVIEHDRWDGYADDVSSRAVYETAPRGDILDRNGKKLATSKAVYSVNLSRINLSEEDALAASAEVFKVLKANDEDIETTQEEVSKTLVKKDYQAYLPVTLSRQVSRESAMEIMEKQLPGIQIAVNYIRE